MSQDTGSGIAMLVAGFALGLWALWRIRSGKSYISRPAMKVAREEDPFSFWLSVIPMLAVAIALIVGGIAYLHTSA